MAELVLTFSRRGFPFTPKHLCSLAYEVAVKTKQKGFSPIKKRAGRYWLQGFLRRHVELKKKNCVNLSLARAMGANPVQIKIFFTNYRKWLESWNLEHSPNHIWNVDESGVGDVPAEGTVIGVKGETAFQTVSGELSQNTTVLTYVSAGGLVVPPMIIFKGGKVKQEWREAAPTGYFIRSSSTGYINAKLFADYGEKFVHFLHEKKITGRHVVLLDSHKSHLFNLNYMEYMAANQVEVVCFPPHCTHLLQPLDDIPYARLKAAYQQELADFNLRISGQKMSQIQFFRIFVPAFTTALAPELVRKGFERTGIYPVNSQVDKLKQIGPSDVTDKCECTGKCLAVDSLVRFWFVSGCLMLKFLQQAG